MPAINPASAVELGLGVVQGILGAVKQGKERRIINGLVKSRQAFQTPEEIYQQLNATESAASNGLGSETLNYLTGETNRAFSSGIGASTLLGGDPNDLSALFDQKMQGIMKIGAENHAANLANFTRYLGALNTLSDNKAAEQISKDNLIKDQIQAASAAGGQGTLNLQGGINTFLSGIATNQQSKLFTDRTNALNNNTFNALPGAANITRVPDYSGFLGGSVSTDILGNGLSNNNYG